LPIIQNLKYLCDSPRRNVSPLPSKALRASGLKRF
jgi:hypothetical protein